MRTPTRTQSLTLPLSLRCAIAALVLAAGSACSQAPRTETGAPVLAATPVAAAVPAAASSLTQQIDAQIGDAACDSSQQCRTVPVGSKPCGGPAGYRAWSSKNSDGVQLAQLAARQAEDQKKADSASGRLSTCSMVMDPGATCSAGRCILNKAGSSAQ